MKLLKFNLIFLPLLALVLVGVSKIARELLEKKHAVLSEAFERRAKVAKQRRARFKNEERKISSSGSF